MGQCAQNIYHLVSMFGGIVDISGGSVAPHTWVLWWLRFGAPKGVRFFQILWPRGAPQTWRHFTRFSHKIVRGLLLQYAGGFRPPNIYLLFTLDGSTTDISLESVRPRVYELRVMTFDHL